MHLWWIICLGLLTTTTPAVNADAMELLSHGYSLFVSGGRLLHDVAGGMGIISKLLRTFDYFLDYSAQEQIEEAIADSGDSGESTSSKSPVQETQDQPESPDSTTKAATSSSADLPPQSSGGCGILGLQITDQTLPIAALRKCCGSHDVCYSSTCKVKKANCDKELSKCLKLVCDDLMLEWQIQKNCQGAVKLLYSGTMALSSQQYRDAQEKLSCRKEESRERRGGRH